MSVSSISAMPGGSPLSGGLATGQGATPRQTPLPEVSTPKSETTVLKDYTPDLLQTAVDEANKLFSQTRSDVRFVIDKDSNKVVIKLVEPATGEVINQYPTDQALAISNAIAHSQQLTAERHAAFKSSSAGFTGLLFKQKI